MAASSWMQHPVGYAMNSSTHRAELTDIWAVLTNPVFLMGYAHVLLASAVTGSLLMLGVSAYHLLRKNNVESFHLSARLGLIVSSPPSL